MLLALAGLVIVVVLAWFVLEQVKPYLPNLLYILLYVVLVIAAIVALCRILSIPLPGLTR